jgi:FlaA1/EpsC-like NDP-sugar epimerase
MTSVIRNQTILVTGACGTIGSALVERLLTDRVYEPKEVVGIDNNESQLFFLEQKYAGDKRANFFVADIRDLDELDRRMKGIDIVFHAAALKHVVLCERSPEQVIQTNIVGLQNVVKASIANGAKRVVFTSSDKAVNPTNVMGTSKLMGERLMTAANSRKRGLGPIFTSTRFGNVLGSNGSVVPIFHNQIAQGGPLTLTERTMTRFVMSTEEAVRLLIDSSTMMQGGEVVITKMPVVRIADLAQAMVEELAPRYGYREDQIEILEIGVKPGEKLFEELMSMEETRRAIELENYFVVLPAFRGIYGEILYDYKNIVSETVSNPYVSSRETKLDIGAIRDLLRINNLLSPPIDRVSQRYWPGDKQGGE